MRLLVLGGTRFVGRAIVEEALGRGHEVITFNRGHTGVDVAGVEAVRGDRESSADLQRLVAGRSWDVVVDTSGYVPRVVGNAARALLGLAGRYVFLSTISVYPDWPANGVSEASPVYECSPDAGGSAADEASWSATQYGTYKAGCERAVAEVFGDRALVLRPGVILGPQENVGRLTWWLRRIARGGRVLGPGSPDRSIQPIDVRDVASFALDLAGSRRAGAIDAAAPKGHATFGSMLAHCAHATGSNSELVWVDDGFLVEQGVRQWTEIPLWRLHAGTWDVDTTMARTAGLLCRPLAETVRDTWAWMGEDGGPAPYGRQAQHGLSPEREQQLLALWEAQAGQGQSLGRRDSSTGQCTRDGTRGEPLDLLPKASPIGRADVARLAQQPLHVAEPLHEALDPLVGRQGEHRHKRFASAIELASQEACDGQVGAGTALGPVPALPRRAHFVETDGVLALLKCPADVAKLEIGAAAAERLPRLVETELATDVVVQLVSSVGALPLRPASRERLLGVGPAPKTRPCAALDAQQPHARASSRGTAKPDVDPVDRLLWSSCPQGDRRLHAGGPGKQLVVLGDGTVGPSGTGLRGSRVWVPQVEAGAGEEPRRAARQPGTGGVVAEAAAFG